MWNLALLIVPLAFLAVSCAKSHPVKVGADVLAERKFAPLVGKRVGVITNHTGRDARGTHLVDLLLQNKVNVVKLFSPEHGLYGVKDEKVADGVDEKTGLPVYSLYGRTRRPTTQALQELDVVVFDIQDVGTRFYTYISTLGLSMEEAARHGIEFVVLDRPNPISGTRVEGPIADADKLTFTAYRRIPLVHGMTVGELARLFNDEHKARLTVIPMEGWRREMYWDDTGVKWVNPSPNMRSPTQALLYPAIGLLESSNVSVGRGTDSPFEQFGAPYVDGERLARELTRLQLPGVTFAPVTFRPNDKIHKHHDAVCHGVRVTVTDREKFDSTATGMALIWTMSRLYPNDWGSADTFLRMAANKEVVDAVLKLDDPRKANDLYRDALEAWKRVRAKYLIY